MRYKVVTPVSSEPLALSEVKAHLRLDSGSYADDISTTQLLVPASRVANTYTSSGIDIGGLDVLVNLNSGTNQATGTVDVHIEESDDDATYTDWTGGTFTQVTTANDNAVQEIQYTGSKQYIRVVAVVANAECEFSVEALINSGDTSEDSLLTMWITTAREFGEDYTGHAFAPQTIDYYLDDFPKKDYIEWPFPPLTSVTSVKYKVSDGSETTMTATTQYLTDVDSFPGKIALPYNVSWPTFTAYPLNPIIIRGVCGYTGADHYILPNQYKQAMLMHIGFMYKYRDVNIPNEHMDTIKRLYDMRRVVHV